MSSFGCVICQEVFQSTEDATSSSLVAIFNCGHVFHGICLSQWLLTTKSCPVCRSSVTAANVSRLHLQDVNGPNESTFYLPPKLTEDKEKAEMRNKLSKANQTIDHFKTQIQEMQASLNKINNELVAASSDDGQQADGPQADEPQADEPPAVENVRPKEVPLRIPATRGIRATRQVRAQGGRSITVSSVRQAPIASAAAPADLPRLSTAPVPCSSRIHRKLAT